MAKPNRAVALAAAIAVVAGVLPLWGYWHFVKRVPSVTPDEARELLAQAANRAVLVDVRTGDEYAARHLEDAQSWPCDKILAIESRDDVPRPFRGKQLLLICDAGFRGAQAVRRLGELGVSDVANVQGGLQAWVAGAERPCALGLCRLRLASGESQGLPFRESPLVEQWTLVLTGFVVKPFYMLLALGLAMVLWRRREADLAILCWAMAAFFVGEAFCAANYLAYGERSLLFEYLHCCGMVLSFGLVTFAGLEAADRRIVRLSDPGATCAAIALCQQCVKYKPVPCGLRRVFLVVIPAAIVMALAPLTASLVPVAYNTRILGTFYTHTHAVAHQMFEARYLPIAALVLLAIALAVLLAKRAEAVFWSKLFYSAGMGALGFSYFRAVLLHLYGDNLAWFAIWEEVTELLFVAGTAIVLWIFRRGLWERADAQVHS